MKTRKFAIVRARFNAPITQALLDGALRAFAAAGIAAADVKTVEVPGAFELPVAALWLAQSNEYAAIVAIGCVIRGETPHFDFVAGEAARGLGEVALRTGVPISFGVLTTDTAAQAASRASSVDASSPEHGNAHRTSNKGFEAAQAAMAMATARANF
jgi:6,7-dimethyl-8-ribityllumazine synthase